MGDDEQHADAFLDAPGRRVPIASAVALCVWSVAVLVVAIVVGDRDAGPVPVLLAGASVVLAALLLVSRVRRDRVLREVTDQATRTTQLAAARAPTWARASSEDRGHRS